MPRKKNVVKSLLDSAESAFYAGVEIHNKPRIAYRYPTATLLILNAWELTLKAYIYKYIGKKNIYEKGEHTISFSKALAFTREKINVSENNKNFNAVYDNLSLLEEYRNVVAHYFESANDPIVFMLLARATLNYNDFVTKYFKREISTDENLIILPIGFSLPFEPVDFLVKKDKSETTNPFAAAVINSIKALQLEGVNDSIVVGFNVFMNSVKKCTNADIIAAIDQSSEKATILKKGVRIVNDTNTPIARIDEASIIKEAFPYTFEELCGQIKATIPDFRRNKNFYSLLHLIKEIPNCYIERLLNPFNPKSSKTGFYSQCAVSKICETYQKQ